MKRTTSWLVLLATAATAWSAETPERMLQRAKQLEDQARLAKAAEVYQAFLKAHPEHSQAPDAHYRLAKCLDGLGLVDEAIQHLVTVIGSKYKRYRHRQEAYYTLGKLYGSLKKYDLAAKVFEQLLIEGAGLYEDEVLALCGGYYAVQKKYDEAAVKFNILKRRQGSRFAEQAAYKLAVLWMRAEKLTLAVEAVEDLATRFPRNKHARGLMIQLADLFRKAKDFDKAIAICAQLRARFPKSQEAQVVGYVMGLCYRDQQEFDKAIKAFEMVAQVTENRKTGLAAEALLQSADVLYKDLGQADRAMRRYEEAAKMARDYRSERQSRILEQCYFRLAEHHFTRKNWNAALEYYLLLRQHGTRVNVLPRILQCQARLDTDTPLSLTKPADIEFIKTKIKQHAGTFIAAEAEVFLVDLKMAQALRSRGGFATVIAGYKEVLAKYPKSVLSQESLESYICAQLGICHSAGREPADLKQAIALFEKAIAVDPKTPYKIDILENMARAADAAGDKQKAFEVYKTLVDMTVEELEKDAKNDTLQTRTAEYIRAMLSRAEQKDSIAEALAVAQRIMDKRGPFSEAARHALFYMGELYYLKRDFSAAARTYKQFIKAYGPKQNDKGDVIDAPWKPGSITDKVRQVYEAAVRIAHCWYMQGHTQNMIQAYRWLAQNLGYHNKYLAEAQYWLALEFGKGKEGRSKENRRKMAEALWKNVVNPSFDFGGRDFRKSFRFWVTDEEMARYVKAAILKSGQAYSELKEHERAAGIFAEFLELFPSPDQRGRRRRDRPPPKPDEMYSIARYALGREYVALADIPRVAEVYRVYVDTMREDRFRVSALGLLGYHAMKSGLYDAAVEAYATLLDEYGENKRDEKGQIIPVPVADRIRSGKYRWDGVRLPVPKGLDLGQVRYSLGFLYWKKEDWANCVKILMPFIRNPQLFDNRSRPKALYMVVQSYYHVRDYEKGVQIVLKLIRDHRKFEAIEEAHMYAAKGCLELGKWSQIERLHERFVEDWPRSGFRPHMDLYAAVATLRQGKTDRGLARLRDIAQSETYGDVKADAYYYLGLHLMSRTPPDYKGAAEHFDKSVALYPREGSCLAAAKCHMKMKNWQKARALLDRAVRSFPTADRRTIEEAKGLLSDVMKQIAKQG